MCIKHRAGWQEGLLNCYRPCPSMHLSVFFRFVVDCSDPISITWPTSRCRAAGNVSRGPLPSCASPGWSCLSDNLLCLPDEPVRKRVYSLVYSRYQSISIEMWKRSNRLPPTYVVVDLSLVKYSQCVDIGSSSPRRNGQCKTVANELGSGAVTSRGMVGSIGACVIGFQQLQWQAQLVRTVCGYI
jgi:hypothetical protein